MFGDNELSSYYSLFEQSSARYLDALGEEIRHVFDVRFAGNANGFDWDLEAMGRAGRNSDRRDLGGPLCAIAARTKDRNSSRSAASGRVAQDQSTAVRSNCEMVPARSNA